RNINLAGIYIVPQLDCELQRQEVEALAIRADRLSGLRQIPRSRRTFPGGRAILPGRLGAGTSPDWALAVGRETLFPGPPGEPFCAIPYRYRHPPRRQDREALLPR